MQKVLNAACSFAAQKYVAESDDLKTKSLPVEECIKYVMCQMTHKSITNKYFPSYLRLEIKKRKRHLRSNTENTSPLIEEGNGRTFAKVKKVSYNSVPKKSGKLKIITTSDII